MELLQLRYFMTVAKYEHMTRAAEELNISQPALSTVIARLEHELGVPLFDRVGRSVSLNEFGKCFQKRAGRVLMELDDSKKMLQDMADLSKSRISLSVTSPQFLQGIAAFLRKEPDIRWQQSVDELHDIVTMLLHGEIDLAVTSPGVYDEELVSTLLLRDEFKIAVHPDHPLARRKSVRLGEIANEKFIMLQKGLPFRAQVDMLLADMGIVPNIAMECDHYLRREFINANAGITISSNSAQFRHLYDSQIRFLDIEDAKLTRDIVLIHRKGKYLSPVVKRFAEYLVEYYKKIQKSDDERRRSTCG